MREIKFRAWNENSKEMIKLSAGTLYVIDIRGGLKEYRPALHSGYNHIRSHEAYFIDLTNFVLMQYTGLKDKNGKEIYEGDIIFHYYYQEIGIVVWHKEQSRWALKYIDEKTQEMFPIDSNNFEIKGNIYENGDLLNAQD